MTGKIPRTSKRLPLPQSVQHGQEVAVVSGRYCQAPIQNEAPVERVGYLVSKAP